MYHNPVLLYESVEALRIHANGIYVDATFGGGGHSRAILSKLDNGKLYGFDQDADARQNLLHDERFTFIPHNFRYLKNFLQLHQALPVDGILADLGVSSFQFDKAEKGFSTRFDGALDMRMDQSNAIDAATIVNTYEAQELKLIFENYGELEQAGRFAAAIVAARTAAPITTTFGLKEAVRRLLPAGRENKPLAQLFQALRIEVNAEMACLESFLEQAMLVLKPGGRLVVISYHSLEDRMVKNFIKAGNVKGEIKKDFYGNILNPLRPVTRKAVTPSEAEISENNRARSAKMRVAEKTDYEQ